MHCHHSSSLLAWFGSLLIITEAPSSYWPRTSLIPPHPANKYSSINVLIMADLDLSSCIFRPHAIALVEILGAVFGGRTRWAPLWIPLDICQTPHHSSQYPVLVSYVKHPVFSLLCIGITIPGLLSPCLTPHPPPLKAVRCIFHASHNFRVFVL